MQDSCCSNFISCQDMSLLEDSRYAFFSSYEVLRDRYNKLKGEYRKLVTRKTCCRCACAIEQRSSKRAISLRLEYANQAKMPVAGVSQVSHSPDTAELIRDVTFLQEKLHRVLRSSSTESDLSSLSNAVASLSELKRQISLPAFNDLLIEEIQRTVASTQVADENVGMPVKVQSVPCFKGLYPEDCNTIEEHMCSLINTVSKQNEELTMVCQKLIQQNEVLTHLLWLRSNESKSDVKDDFLEIEDWSLVTTR